MAAYSGRGLRAEEESENEMSTSNHSELPNSSPPEWALKQATAITEVWLTTFELNDGTVSLDVMLARALAEAEERGRRAGIEEAATFVDGFELMVSHGIGNRRLSLDRMVEKIRALKTQEVVK